MITTESMQDAEDAMGDYFYGDHPKKAADDAASEKCFDAALSEAVKNGAQLEVEKFTTSVGFKVEIFKLITSKSSSLCISKQDAIKFCNYTD